MGVFFDEPDYPVIDKAPQFWKTGDPACAACKSPAEQGANHGYVCSWELQLEGLGNFCRDNCCLLSLRLGSWSVSPSCCLSCFDCICHLCNLHFTGVGPKVPKQSAIMGAMIGGLGGFMLAYQQSSGDSHRKVGTLCS